MRMNWQHPKVEPKDEPPGFLHTLAESELPDSIKALWGATETAHRLHFGLLPAANGNCRWVAIARDGVTAMHPITDLPAPLAAAMQREWLRQIRQGDYWPQICDKLGISVATWAPLADSPRRTRGGFTKRSFDGWSGGRPIPYFRAALLAQAKWECQAEEICGLRLRNQENYPNKRRG